LDLGLQQLHKLLYIASDSSKLPVAFASNALYVLERTEHPERAQFYESLLLPVLREKAQYLHAEGVSQCVWALTKA